MQPKFFQPGWAASRPSSAQLNETLEICCDHPALASDLFFLHVDHHRFLLPLHSVFCASVFFANFTPVCCQFYTTPSVSSRVVVCMVFSLFFTSVTNFQHHSQMHVWCSIVLMKIFIIVLFLIITDKEITCFRTESK
jgi:hypothetical protein